MSGDLNFRQWATFGGMLVSDDFTWFARLSVINTSVGQSLSADVAGDNTSGTGTTPLTWNLQ